MLKISTKINNTLEPTTVDVYLLKIRSRNNIAFTLNQRCLLLIHSIIIFSEQVYIASFQS